MMGEEEHADIVFKPPQKKQTDKGKYPAEGYLPFIYK